MKTEPCFKQVVTAFLAAGAPGASEDERLEAEELSTGLPYQFRSEATALKVLVRDDETRKVVELVYRWSAKPGLVSIVAHKDATHRGAVAL